MTEYSQIGSHQAAAELFDKTVDDYQRRADSVAYNSSSFVFSRRREVVHSLLDHCSSRGLAVDFGMGPGVFAAELVARGYRLVGIDISQAMVDRARQLALENATFIQGDLNSLLPYREQADLVLAIGLLDYLEEPDEGLAKLAACLKPGGHLLISFRNRHAASTYLRDAAKIIWRRLFGRKKWKSDTAFVSSVHEHAFSARADLTPPLRRLGLEPVATRYIDCSVMFFNVPLPKSLWAFWHRVDRVIAGRWTRWGCSTGVLLARKA